MRSSGARFRAGLALLALYIMGGAWGLPVLDAVLYHAVDAGGPSGPHVEPDGGCGHTDGCILGVRAPLSQAAPAQLPAERPAPTARLAPAIRPAVPALLPLRSSQRPRAPPVQTS